MTKNKEDKIAEIEQLFTGEWKAVDNSQYLAVRMPENSGDWGEILISRSPEFTDSYFLKYIVDFKDDTEYWINTVGMSPENRFRYKISLTQDKLIVLFSPYFGGYQTQEYQRLK